MKLARPTAWLFLLLSIAVYLSAAFKLVGLDAFEKTGSSIALGKSVHVSIEQPSKYLIIYNDDFDWIYTPHINYNWMGNPPKIDGFGPSWYGIYYYELSATGYAPFRIFGLSLWYFILLCAIPVSIIEYKAGIIRHRRKQYACPCCGYLRQGLQTQTMHCPECGTDLYP